MTLVDLSKFPGGELVEKGLNDRARRRESVESLLVAIARIRLGSLGLRVATDGRDHPEPDAELRLYRRLRAEHPEDAYTRYNALLRRLISFEKALEHSRAREARLASGTSSEAGAPSIVDPYVSFTGFRSGLQKVSLDKLLATLPGWSLSDALHVMNDEVLSVAKEVPIDGEHAAQAYAALTDLGVHVHRTKRNLTILGWAAGIDRSQVKAALRSVGTSSDALDTILEVLEAEARVPMPDLASAQELARQAQELGAMATAVPHRRTD